MQYERHVIIVPSSLGTQYSVCKKNSHPLWLIMYPSQTPIHLSKHELEDIVKNVETTSSIRQQLESLTVVHGSLLLIDLIVI
jgi:hypothetical protein